MTERLTLTSCGRLSSVTTRDRRRNETLRQSWIRLNSIFSNFKFLKWNFLLLIRHGSDFDEHTGGSFHLIIFFYKSPESALFCSMNDKRTQLPRTIRRKWETNSAERKLISWNIITNFQMFGQISEERPFRRLIFRRPQKNLSRRKK